MTASTCGAQAKLELTGTAQISTHLQAKSIQGKLISNFRVCLQVFQILFQTACLLMQWWYSHFRMHARTHYTRWMVAEVLKICCCIHNRQIDWQVSTNDKSLPLHLAHEDLVRAWMQCYSSFSIPAAMVYFAAFDHKKRLNSSLSCAWCSNLNLLHWAQTWIKAAVVQVHTPTLEPGSGHVCISWVTSSSCQPFLPRHLLPAPWPSHHHASRSISTAVHWSSTGICAGSN